MNALNPIFSLGAVYLDINGGGLQFGADGFPVEQELVGQDYEMVIGGSAVNFAKISAALGLPTMFMGKVGNDPASQLLAGLFEQSGINTLLIKDDACQTNVGINLMNTDTKTVMAVFGNANQSLTPQEVEPVLMPLIEQQSIGAWYLGGVYKQPHMLPLYSNLVSKAQAQGIQVILDHGRVNDKVTPQTIEAVKSLIFHVNYYVPSVDELLQTWNAKSIEDAYAKLHVINPDCVVVVKCGEEGAMYWDQKKTMQRIPIFKVNVISTVGAGDAFNAGLYALVQETGDLETAVRAAHATAALKISQAQLPSKQQVMELAGIR